MAWEGLEELVASCRRCPHVGKPFVEHQVYRLWLPEEIKLLIVTESPPPGQKEDFFYNLSKPDAMRRNFMVILGLEGMSDTEVPRWFKGRGAFITNAIKCRPIRPEGRYRDPRLLTEMTLNCTHVLELEVELLRPKKIIAMGTYAQLSVSRLGLPHEKLYHPNYLARFRRDLIPSAREAILRALRDPLRG